MGHWLFGVCVLAVAGLVTACTSDDAGGGPVAGSGGSGATAGASGSAGTAGAGGNAAAGGNAGSAGAGGVAGSGGAAGASGSAGTGGGSFPANNPGAWGHLHPSCPSLSTFTTCPSSVSAGQTVQNCTGGDITLNGSNITLSCVNLSTTGARGVFCNGTCQNVVITKSTFTGAGPTTDTSYFNLSSSYGGSGPHTMLIEKSVIQRSRNAIILGGGKFNASNAAIEPGFAFVARENIFRDPQWAPSAHSEHVALVESTNGALFEKNVFDCDTNFNGGNPCNTAHMLGQPANGATIQNITIQGNRFIGDKASTNGYEFTFDNHPPDGCVQPVQFRDNLIEQYTTIGIFNTGSCGNLSSRPGSSCSGNTVNGSPLGC